MFSWHRWQRRSFLGEAAQLRVHGTVVSFEIIVSGEDPKACSFCAASMKLLHLWHVVSCCGMASSLTKGSDRAGQPSLTHDNGAFKIDRGDDAGTTLQSVTGPNGTHCRLSISCSYSRIYSLTGASRASLVQRSQSCRRVDVICAKLCTWHDMANRNGIRLPPSSSMGVWY